MDKLVFQGPRDGAPFMIGLGVVGAAMLLVWILRPWRPGKVRWHEGAGI
jgi:hypothetical protein